MKIGYAKIGRSWKLDPTKGTATGGDADVARALHLLARARPDDEIILVSNNSGEDPSAAHYPSNVTNPWGELRQTIKTAKAGSDVQKATDLMCGLTESMYMELDALIVWAGQHGTSNMPIPTIEDRSEVTKPQISFVNYGSYILNGINKWRDVDPLSREEMWLCPDPRNYLKCRDLKWPLRDTVIAQYSYERQSKHERYGDARTDPATWDSQWDPKVGEGVWLSPSRYSYNALELTCAPHPDHVLAYRPIDWGQRLPFGMLVNENRAYVSKDRLSIMQDWVLNRMPDAEIFGAWSDKSKQAMGRLDIVPVAYDQIGATLQRWRTTLTTPASGSGWATAKPWECFAHGVVCFFHPHYDDQDHILGDAPKELRDWLRVPDTESLWKRVDHLNNDQAAWEWIIAEQRKHYSAKYREHQGGIAEIMRRLG